MPGDDAFSRYTQQSIETKGLVKGKRIVVLKSGDGFFYKTVVINSRECPNTPRFMQRMTELGDLNSSCKRVYDMQGRSIEHASEIEDGGRYIITDERKLKRIGYETITPKRYRYQGNHMSNGYFGGSSDFGHNEVQYLQHPFVGYQRNNRPRTLPSIVGGPNSSRVGGGQNYSSPDYSVASNPEDGRNAKRPHNGYPLNKPQRHKPSPERQRKTQKSQQVDYDRNDGVFRAKGSNRETQGAKEVKDSSHTRTDLPIDQRKAEIVSDEEYDDDKYYLYKKEL
ncbi:hypothetical protein KUTeg_000667 [Tegillarca granosa]|uniref:Doublecortin domain-containing protein n=1 Tax=Tegillarca granosa TaxID=220873 RepID=A0ABQ9G1B8_TEGGR|nr:hypothetical protein KUTeg_000667 [Tegillarca granosa]